MIIQISQPFSHWAITIYIIMMGGSRGFAGSHGINIRRRKSLLKSTQHLAESPITENQILPRSSSGVRQYVIPNFAHFEFRPSIPELEDNYQVTYDWGSSVYWKWGCKRVLVPLEYKIADINRWYFTNLILRYLIHLKPVNSVVSFMLASFFGLVQLGRSVYTAYDWCGHYHECSHHKTCPIRISNSRTFSQSLTITRVMRGMLIQISIVFILI